MIYYTKKRSSFLCRLSLTKRGYGVFVVVRCCVCVVGVGLFFLSGGGLFCNNTQKIMLCDIIFFFDIQKKNYWSHNFL